METYRHHSPTPGELLKALGASVLLASAAAPVAVESTQHASPVVMEAYIPEELDYIPKDKGTPIKR